MHVFKQMIHFYCPARCLKHAVWQGSLLICPVCREKIACTYKTVTGGKLYVFHNWKRHRSKVCAAVQNGTEDFAPVAKNVTDEWELLWGTIKEICGGESVKNNFATPTLPEEEDLLALEYFDGLSEQTIS